MRRLTSMLLGMALLSYGTAVAEPPRADGAAVFKARCASCHGDGGRTDTAVGRVLKVAPLVNDPKLARMTPAEIVELVMTDPKHRGVINLGEDDIRAAATFVKQLAGTK